MTMQSHPSDEQLNAFFDRQLPLPEHEHVDSHLHGCPLCRGIVEEIGVLQLLGPAVEESLPSDLYWKDLPDRVLARIALEERPAPAAAPAPEQEAPWWRRLASPGVGLPWLAATAVVAVAAGFLVTGRGEAPEIANSTGSADVSVPYAELPRDVPPLGAESVREEDYRQRVATTIGVDGNFGTSLDVVPVVGGRSASTEWNISRVGLSSPVPVGGLSDRSILAGTPELQYYFATARRAEEVGRNDIAIQGYRILHAKAHPDHPARLAAEIGFTRCVWRDRVAHAGEDGPRVLNDLHRSALELYGEHEAGRHARCRQAWEAFVSYIDLAEGCATPQTIEESKRLLKDLERCVR